MNADLKLVLMCNHTLVTGNFPLMLRIHLCLLLTKMHWNLNIVCAACFSSQTMKKTDLNSEAIIQTKGHISASHFMSLSLKRAVFVFFFQ